MTIFVLPNWHFEKMNFMGGFGRLATSGNPDRQLGSPTLATRVHNTISEQLRTCISLSVKEKFGLAVVSLAVPVSPPLSIAIFCNKLTFLSVFWDIADV